MATITGNIGINVRLVQAAPTGYSGGDVASVSLDAPISSGTNANQGDLLYSGTTSVTGASSVDLDLRAVTSPAGAALSGLVEIVAIVIEWPSSATASLLITPSASNGVTSVGSPSLVPGGKLVMYCSTPVGYAIDATHKSLNLANAGTTALATITLLGRSA